MVGRSTGETGWAFTGKGYMKPDRSKTTGGIWPSRVENYCQGQ